ncbi:MAG: hypothetical protein DRP35_08195 [Candidatus Zixiibacteriota bacterium]|nr:MAG: hypothetical protein DRP35_08195 [candidate division Zixibacteria bacterium]
MEKQFKYFLTQIKEKTERLITKIDTQNKEIIRLTEDNKTLRNTLNKQKEISKQIKQEKLEQEYSQFVSNKDKNQKQEIEKNIDNVIRVIDKTIMLLNK